LERLDRLLQGSNCEKEVGSGEVGTRGGRQKKMEAWNVIGVTGGLSRMLMSETERSCGVVE